MVRRDNRILLAGIPVALLLVMMLGNKTGDKSLWTVWWKENIKITSELMYELFLPAVSYEKEDAHATFWLIQDSMNQVLPIYEYITKNQEETTTATWAEQTDAVERILLPETQVLAFPDEEEETADQQMEETQTIRIQEEMQEENPVRNEERDVEAFVPHQQVMWMDIDKLEDYDTLLDMFYTVDPSTTVSGTRLSASEFLKKDFKVSKEGEGPQILIFHTHSQESFIDSVPGDRTTSIVGVGDYLTEVLTEKYGYKVLHHTESYDAENRNNAYSKALSGIEKVLQENPQIEVIIDLHRDEMREGNKLVMDLDGRPTARFMFFNGLSRTRKTGDISYLYNENQEENLAFSFQMQLMAAQYYPGLTRKIYLKGYRYNMHLKEKYLLVELGAQNNTVEEAKNACDPLAHILDLVLDN